MAKTNITVLGAGVSGLTTALLLSRDAQYNITVVAKHMPGDDSIEYCSNRAGANYMPFAGHGTESAELEAKTWPELSRLARDVPEAGIHFQDCYVYRRNKDVGTPVGDWVKDLIREDAWFKDLLPNFRVLPKESLPGGMDGGTAFGSVCINPEIYLAWLVSQCLKNGVKFRRGDVKHIQEASRLHHSGQRAQLVVNCTGLGSISLGGVEDKKLYPGRGQVVLVRNEPRGMVTVSGTNDGPDEAAYVMNRAAGGGCVLGGCMQPGVWESQTDPNLSIRIMKRCVELCPELVPKGSGIEALSVIGEWTGLRPMRESGIRVEKETIKGEDSQPLTAVHSYGHGGYGFQTSYGCAEKVITLVREALKEKARL
ncbi:hypothetical protein MBLNU457_1178t1 [Dothideomycetes sp. NU457]